MLKFTFNALIQQLRPLHTAEKHHPTMSHTATVRHKRSGPRILYNTSLNELLHPPVINSIKTITLFCKTTVNSKQLEFIYNTKCGHKCSDHVFVDINYLSHVLIKLP